MLLRQREWSVLPYFPPRRGGEVDWARLPRHCCQGTTYLNSPVRTECEVDFVSRFLHSLLENTPIYSHDAVRRLKLLLTRQLCWREQQISQVMQETHFPACFLRRSPKSWLLLKRDFVFKPLDDHTWPIPAPLISLPLSLRSGWQGTWAAWSPTAAPIWNFSWVVNSMHWAGQ